AERMPGNKVVSLNTALVLLLDVEKRTLTREDTKRIDRYLQRVAAVDPDNRTLNKLQRRLQALRVVEA
ncbi:MAG: hypothetical protein P8166_18350, partial [Candidatus Thiodiazotropha sp.]